MNRYGFLHKVVHLRNSDFAKKVLGSHCAFCESMVPFGEDLCDDCSCRLIEVVQKDFCLKCKCPKSECKCKSESFFFDFETAPFLYMGSMVVGIDRLKFKSHVTGVLFLARKMAETALSVYGDKMDFVTYVPISKQRLAERGFDQSRLLAKEMADIMDVPFVEDVLIKIVDNKPQSKCDYRERRANVIYAYEVNRNIDITNCVILLVDDICTTGATLNECSQMLKIFGARTVLGLTASMTLHPESKYLEKIKKDVDKTE